MWSASEWDHPSPPGGDAERAYASLESSIGERLYANTVRLGRCWNENCIEKGTGSSYAWKECGSSTWHIVGLKEHMALIKARCRF